MDDYGRKFVNTPPQMRAGTASVSMPPDTSNILSNVDTTANAIAANCIYVPGSSEHGLMAMRHKMKSGTVVSTTFKIRVGTHSSGNWYVNSVAGGGSALYGGLVPSYIEINEVFA